MDREEMSMCPGIKACTPHLFRERYATFTLRYASRGNEALGWARTTYPAP
jgi:hypothetical protein